MANEPPRYLHLKPGDLPPRLDDAAPFKAVVVIEGDVAAMWQAQVSDWLVRSGCRYMMAWGHKCGDWDTSVDEAKLAKVAGGDLSDDHIVMTTWHADEPLAEAFWFSQRCAMHPSLQLERTYIVHIAPEDRASELLAVFREAIAKTD